METFSALLAICAGNSPVTVALFTFLIMACHPFGAKPLPYPIGLLGTNFSEILIEILTIAFKIMHLKLHLSKWWPFCPGADELNENKKVM